MNTVSNNERRIRVWDLPLRVFHWALAFSFAGAYLLSESERLRHVHVMFGYTVLGLIAFRLVWGFIGTRYSRFTSFLFGPTATLRYVKSIAQGTPEHHVGHNPLGSYAVYSILGLGVLTGVSGYLTLNEIGGDAAEEFHEVIANVWLAVVGVHIAGVIISSFTQLEELDLDEEESGLPYRQSVAFQIWRGGRELVLKSTDAPAARLSQSDSGLSDATIAGTHWRVYSQWDRHRRILVQVAEDHAVRDKLAARIALNTTLPMLLSVPVLVLVIGWAITRALRPVLLLGREVEGRQALALQPITAPGVPKEIAPLIDKLNDLFSRVRQALEQERRFTANAAHELRTPLSALRVQAEVARDSDNPTATRAALDQVIVACDRLTRLTSQLLTLARADEQAAERSRCRLDGIAREVIAELAPQAFAADQEVSLDAPDAIEIDGNASLLAAMIRNLIENALRYGGSPLHVSVSLSRTEGGVFLTVIDDGHGVPEEALKHLGTRFFRPSGTPVGGSGLGLALVRRIAEWHGGTLDLSAGRDGRGLRAFVKFPPPPQGAVPSLSNRASAAPDGSCAR